MKKHITLLQLSAICLGLILAFGSPAAGQPCPPVITLSHASADQLSLSDVDFEHFHSTTLLFTLTIGNPGPLPIDVTLGLALDIQFSDGSGSYLPAVNYLSKPFTVPVGGRVITNLNLGLDGTDIKKDKFEFDEAVKQRLKDAGLGTGSLPAGIYTFHLRIQRFPEAVCPDFAEDQFVLVIENPSRIELRSPRDGETTTQFPLFEFSYDGDASELIVAEKMSDQTREDAIARRPAMLDVPLANQNSYFYAGGRPLEQGKTYVWRVIGKISGPNGRVTDLPSDVGEFTVGSGAPETSFDAALGQLEEIFGKRYPGIFQEIHQNGFTLQQSMSLNGTTITTQDLLTLLNQLRDQADTAELSFE
jgi:hypothetical protein